MTEYIEREAALNASKIVYIEYIEIDGNGYEDGNADEIPVVFRRDIEAIPAADVVPVVHGRWIYKGARCRFPVCECSVCGNAENADWAILGNNVNFCPNCGAKMDKEEK